MGSSKNLELWTLNLNFDQASSIWHWRWNLVMISGYYPLPRSLTLNLTLKMTTDQSGLVKSADLLTPPQSQTPTPQLLMETFNMGGNEEPLAHDRSWIDRPLKLLLPAGASPRSFVWGGGGFIGTQMRKRAYPKNLVSPRISATLFCKCWKCKIFIYRVAPPKKNVPNFNAIFCKKYLCKLQAWIFACVLWTLLAVKCVSFRPFDCLFSKIHTL